MSEEVVAQLMRAQRPEPHFSAEYGWTRMPWRQHYYEPAQLDMVVPNVGEQAFGERQLWCTVLLRGLAHAVRAPLDQSRIFFAWLSDAKATEPGSFAFIARMLSFDRRRFELACKRYIWLERRRLRQQAEQVDSTGVGVLERGEDES